MAKMKDGLFCADCGIEMKQVILDKYEYLVGHPLHHVPAYQCPKCKNTFFTEEQSHEMEARTKELMEYTFGFERKVLVTGKSLAIGIPAELADHLKIKQGQKVRIIPIARDGFMIRKIPV